MNISLISYEFPPMFGGEGMYTYGLAKALSDLGHNVRVITADTRGRMESMVENFEIIRLITIKKPGLKLFSFNLKAVKKIEEIYKSHQEIDILHFTYDFYKITLSKEKINIPIIATLHHPWSAEHRIIKAGTPIDYPNYYFRRVVLHHFEKMSKKTCNNADKLIAVSNYTAQSYITEFRVPQDKIEVIPDAVDTNKFHPEVDGYEIRKKLNLADKDRVVLFVGRLDYNKGIEYLLRSFSRINEEDIVAKLVIVGEGLLKKYIQAFKRNYPEKIVPVGRISEEDLPKFYAASDLVVLPSLMEGFGIVLLEAMASGKPCVATRAGGVEDVVINGETGLLIPPADSYSLYHAIYTLLTDDKLSKEFGAAGRKRAENYFTWDKVAKHTVEVYKKVM